MSDKSVAGKVKKFKGFTDIFKNANAKTAKPAEPEVVKKPFTGFTAAFKNFKPPECPDYMYDDDDDDEDADNLIAPPEIPQKVEPVKIVYEHFVPTKYNEWRDERLDAIQERMQTIREQKPDAAGGDEVGAEKIDDAAADFAAQPAPSARLPFPRDRVVADSFPEPQTVAKFHPSAAAAPPEYTGANDGRRVSSCSGGGGSGGFFRSELPPFRDLNEYPMRYQLEKLNDRMGRYLRTTNATGADEQMTDTRSSSGRGAEELACRRPRLRPLDVHKRDLTSYFGENVDYCRTRKLDFGRETFPDWYARYTYNYERKFKDAPRVPLVAYPEEFGSWLRRVSETVEDKLRDFPEKLTKRDILRTHAYRSDRAVEPMRTIFYHDESDASLRGGGASPSLSHCESCRQV